MSFGAKVGEKRGFFEPKLGQNGGDFGTIFARIMSAWGQKGIVGCNVMTIHNEALLLITSGLWVKVGQWDSGTVRNHTIIHQK